MKPNLSATSALFILFASGASYADILLDNVTLENLEEFPTGKTVNINVGDLLTINGFETARDASLAVDGRGADQHLTLKQPQSSWERDQKAARRVNSSFARVVQPRWWIYAARRT